MTEKKILAFWQQSATDDLHTAKALFRLGRYHHCLFFCHLSLEKMIKGLVHKNTKKYPLPIHNLVKLSQQAGLKLSVKQVNDLEEITTWNIKARYDSIKRDLYKKATKKFTQEWLKKVAAFFLWFKNQY